MGKDRPHLNHNRTPSTARVSSRRRGRFQGDERLAPDHLAVAVGHRQLTDHAARGQRGNEPASG